MVLPFFITAALLGLLALGVRNRVLDQALLFLFLAAFTGFVAYTWAVPDTQALDGLFRADGLARLLLTLMAVLVWPIVLAYYAFAKPNALEDSIVAFQNGGIIFFIMALTATVMAQHLWLLWACLEASTLAASMLIYHDRNQWSLEATWKYLFVGSIGVVLAFAGILLISYTGHTDAGLHDYSLTALHAVAGQLHPVWAKLGFLLILTGFSVKMGTFPIFTVDIDAKDASPSAVGALFSGALMSVGFVGLWRVVAVFQGSPFETWIQHVLLLTGLLTVAVSAIYLQRVKRYKRLLAYSSMEHAGIILLAIGAGGALGQYAALLHLLLHGLVKAAAFLQIGILHRRFPNTPDLQLGDYIRTPGIGGGVLVVVLLGILSLPPSGLFVSELLVFQALFQAGHIGVAVGLGLLLVLAAYGILSHLLHVLFAPAGPAPSAQTAVPFTTWGARLGAWLPLLLLITAGILAVWQPDFVSDVLATLSASTPALAASF